jgi:RimJ/RimL family protein N-acetyltransferase
MGVSNLLAGDHVRLTAFEPRDLPALARWYQDAAFMRLFDAEACEPKTEAELAGYLEKQHKSKTAFVFAIRLLERDDLIGYIELDGIVWAQGSGWVSVGFGDAIHRGQGHGTEAMRLLLQSAFGELNLRRVQLTVFSYNAAAIRLYEKLGFRREGAFREFVQRDSQLYDMYLYGLLRREWEASRG